MKYCSTCKQEKDSSLFASDKRSPDGLNYQCKSCKNIRAKKYREKDIEHTRLLNNARVARWQKAHPEIKNIYQNRYSKAHPEIHKSYREAHREKYRVHHRNRYSLLLGVPGNGITEKQWKELKESYLHTCVYCGKKTYRLEMDHVVPITKGGYHSIDNIVPACRNCNSSKNNHNLLSWMITKMRIDQYLVVCE